MSVRQVKTEIVREIHDCDNCGLPMDYSPRNCKVCGGEFCAECEQFVVLIQDNQKDRLPIWGGMWVCKNCWQLETNVSEEMKHIAQAAANRTAELMQAWRAGRKVLA